MAPFNETGTVSSNKHPVGGKAGARRARMTFLVHCSQNELKMLYSRSPAEVWQQSVTQMCRQLALTQALLSPAETLHVMHMPCNACWHGNEFHITQPIHRIRVSIFFYLMNPIFVDFQALCLNSNLLLCSAGGCFDHSLSSRFT